MTPMSVMLNNMLEPKVLRPRFWVFIRIYRMTHWLLIVKSMRAKY